MIDSKFFGKPNNVTTKEIAQIVNGEIIGDENLVISGISTILQANEHDMIFMANKKYTSQLQETKSLIALIEKSSIQDTPNHITKIIVKNVMFAYTQISKRIYSNYNNQDRDFVQQNNEILIQATHECESFSKRKKHFKENKKKHLNEIKNQTNNYNTENSLNNSNTSDILNNSIGNPNTTTENTSSIAKTAIISPYAIIGKNVTIKNFAVIHDGVIIGDNSIIGNFSVINKCVTIGENAHIYDHIVISYANIGKNVTINSGSKIGEHGFGIIQEKDKLTMIPQLGRVIIGDHVRVGANVTIDRGTIDDTQIGNCTMIGNLVEIAHNVTIGNFCIIVAQTGIAGSTKIGDNVVLGGQVGVAGHLTIGNKTMVAAKSGIHTDVKENSTIGGIPAVDIITWKRQSIFLKNCVTRKKTTEKETKECE